MSFGSLVGRGRRGAQPRRASRRAACRTPARGASRDTTATAATSIWQIGTGLLRLPETPTGRSTSTASARPVAANPIRAIEIKLSQGAKPGLGGILPGAKITAEIARIRGVPRRPRLHQPGRPHRLRRRRRAARLRRARSPTATGLPVGIKSAVGELDFWRELADAHGARAIAASTSSPSTAARAAPARRRWSSATTWRCRSSWASAASTAIFAGEGSARARRVHRLRQAGLPASACSPSPWAAT